VDSNLRRNAKLVLVAAVWATLLPIPLFAQLPGTPVHFSPSVDAGVDVQGEGGGGSRGGFWSGRATTSLAYATIEAAVGRGLDFGGLAWGGSGALNLVRGSDRGYSLSVQGGYSRGRISTLQGVESRQDVPIGIGFAPEIRQWTGVNAEFWVGGRIHYRRTLLEPSRREASKVGVGVSTGLNLHSAALHKKFHFIPKGFGIHVAADYVALPRPFTAGREHSVSFAAGLGVLLPWERLPKHGLFPPKDSGLDPPEDQ
jgi:hypothetical protein